jgi:hypothetical protein
MSGSQVGWTGTMLLAVLCSVALPTMCVAQTVSPSEREALVRLRVDRGGRSEDVDALIRHADEAAAKGLPIQPLTNKIREGLAKGYDPERIASVVRQIAVHLETADRVLRGLQPNSSATSREPHVILLADALGGGVTADEVGEIRRQSEVSGKPPVTVTAEGLAGAAKGLSFVKEARLPVSEGTAVMAEAVRQGFRSYEMLDLGREIKRRQQDYREGRASLMALRDAIARGRSEQLFRDRPVSVDRPAATRPAPTADRPEPVTRPERPQPPERPTRPEGRDGARTR